MQQITAVTISAALAGFGHLAQRWLRRDNLAEAIDRRLKLVTLYCRMRSANLNDDDLERMERQLSHSITRSMRSARMSEAGDP